MYFLVLFVCNETKITQVRCCKFWKDCEMFIFVSQRTFASLFNDSIIGIIITNINIGNIERQGATSLLLIRAAMLSSYVPISKDFFRRIYRGKYRVPQGIYVTIVIVSSPSPPSTSSSESLERRAILISDIGNGIPVQGSSLPLSVSAPRRHFCKRWVNAHDTPRLDARNGGNGKRVVNGDGGRSSSFPSGHAEQRRWLLCEKTKDADYDIDEDGGRIVIGRTHHFSRRRGRSGEGRWRVEEEVVSFL
ncbi:hypothetical protein Trydic_g5280 [Trypoxylus dichotomus]